MEGRLTIVPAGQFICMEGNLCAYLPLMLSGTARVFKTGENGREITLYRIEAGESCILTASCILSDKDFPAFAMVETEVEALLIPSRLFQLWFDRVPEWRFYVLGLMADRLSSVISIIEEVAFRRMDARIAGYLLDCTTDESSSLKTTHEAVASDLGTSREVVSRILKDFENEGLIGLARGCIYVRNRNALYAKTGQIS